MRIPSDRFENVAVTELSHAVASSSTLTDKKKSDEPEEPPPKTPLSATTSSSSLLSHLAHLKLPQFRISTPGGGTESSTPSSPVTGRRKQALAAQQSYSASGQHQPLSRHLSLSANATPVRYDFSFFHFLLWTVRPMTRGLVILFFIFLSFLYFFLFTLFICFGFSGTGCLLRRPSPVLTPNSSRERRRHARATFAVTVRHWSSASSTIPFTHCIRSITLITTTTTNSSSSPCTSRSREREETKRRKTENSNINRFWTRLHVISRDTSANKRACLRVCVCLHLLFFFIFLLHGPPLFPSFFDNIFFYYYQVPSGARLAYEREKKLKRTPLVTLIHKTNNIQTQTLSEKIHLLYTYIKIQTFHDFITIPNKTYN